MPFFRDPLFDDVDRIFGNDRLFGFDMPQLQGPYDKQGKREQGQQGQQLVSGSRMPSLINTRFPAMDIIRKDNEYVVACDVPGVKKEEIKVNITHEGNRKLLHVSGERKDEHVEENKETGYRRVERGFGQFSRAITLPEDIDEKGIKARQDQGVLTVTLPRTKQTPPKQTPVTIE